MNVSEEFIAFAEKLFGRKLTPKEIELLNREPTEEEMEAQAKSWVYGNTKLSNPDITRELVEEVFKKRRN